MSIQVQLGEAIQGPNSLTVNLPDPPNTCYLLFPGREGGVRERVREREGARDGEKDIDLDFRKYGNNEGNECNGTMKQDSETDSNRVLSLSQDYSPFNFILLSENICSSHK